MKKALLRNCFGNAPIMNLGGDPNGASAVIYNLQRVTPSQNKARWWLPPAPPGCKAIELDGLSPSRRKQDYHEIPRKRSQRETKRTTSKAGYIRGKYPGHDSTLQNTKSLADEGLVQLQPWLRTQMYLRSSQRRNQWVHPSSLHPTSTPAALDAEGTAASSSSCAAEARTGLREPFQNLREKNWAVASFTVHHALQSRLCQDLAHPASALQQPK